MFSKEEISTGDVPGKAAWEKCNLCSKKDPHVSPRLTSIRGKGENAFVLCQGKRAFKSALAGESSESMEHSQFCMKGGRVQFLPDIIFRLVGGRKV